LDFKESNDPVDDRYQVRVEGLDDFQVVCSSIWMRSFRTGRVAFGGGNLNLQDSRLIEGKDH
jgi:hypothetical protein